MMKRGRSWGANGLYLFVGLVISGLIGVQLYWISTNMQLQKLAAERSLKSDVNAVINQAVEDAYCVYFNSKAFINKNEGIYMVKQTNVDDKFVAPPLGTIDTLDMYNVFFNGKDTSFFKASTLSFGRMPATVDILLKFKFAINSSHVKKVDTNSYKLHNINDKNYKEALNNKQTIDEIINPDLLDSTIKQKLVKNDFDTVYELGIKRAGAAKFEFIRKGSKPTHLLNSSIKFDFYGDNFNTPYELYLYLPDPMGHAIRSMVWVMISSIAIILALIFSYMWFVRTILNQKKLSEMKNMFINNITHEFNTPITNINLAIENWRHAKANSDYYLGIIQEENTHMEKNVEQILQLATIEHNHIKIYPDKLDIHELIWETVNAFEIQLEQVKGLVVYNFNADKYIYGDRQLLKNLFYNLVDNAIKYRKEDLKISISTFDARDKVVIIIEDNGLGMSADTQKYIFDRFYRGDKSDRHDVKGFGLGLCYVKYIVTAHNGSIDVESRKGLGSKFTIYLPKHIKSTL